MMHPEIDSAVIYFPLVWRSKECVRWLRDRQLVFVSFMNTQQRAMEQGFCAEIIGGNIVWAFRLFRK